MSKYGDVQQYIDPLFDETGDVLAVMRMTESGKYQFRDYLNVPGRSISTVKGETVDEAWRQRMCEWMYGVVDHCNFRRDIVGVSTAYLDLCLSKDTEVINSRRTYQLAAMTSLYLAMKVYDTSYVKLESLLKLGRGLFRAEDVIQMEQRMLSKLQWNVHPPTAMCFLRHYMRLFPNTLSHSTSYMIAEISRFVAEISVCLYKFVKYPRSMIACKCDGFWRRQHFYCFLLLGCIYKTVSALLIAIDGIDKSALPDWQRQLILSRMNDIAKMSYSDSDVQIVTRKLRTSFEKNVDLKNLMSTIDPNCQVANESKQRSEEDGSPKGVVRVTD
jgi:hypothetical protein